MLERAGLRGTESDGIFFSEDAAPSATQVLGRVSFRKNRQNWDLARIKQELARQAAALGADSVVNFEYGQISAKWYEHLLPRWDSESWYGEGDAIRLGP